MSSIDATLAAQLSDEPHWRTALPVIDRVKVGRWALVLGVWTVLGLMESVQSYHQYAAGRRPLPWSLAFGMGMSLWYAWMVVAGLVFLFVRRFPLDDRHWGRRLVLLYAPAGCGFVMLKLLLDWPIIRTFYCPTPHLLTLDVFMPMAVRDQFHKYILIYVALVGVGHALNYYRRYRERELRAAQLEARLAHAHLQLLKTQLNPHFLFNTLNAISALIHKDVEVADRMIARLGELLRMSLEHFGSREVTLEQELDFLNKYLDIEKERFGARLRVVEQVDPAALGARVPYLLLQPLVENALKHGVGRRASAGRVVVRARRAGDRLRLEVEDDGVGVSPNHREGVGLANTRARLRQLYPEAHAFGLRPGADGGAVAEIEVPFTV
jgi:signal transduction histidine kinase